MLPHKAFGNPRVYFLRNVPNIQSARASIVYDIKIIWMVCRVAFALYSLSHRTDIHILFYAQNLCGQINIRLTVGQYSVELSRKTYDLSKT